MSDKQKDTGPRENLDAVRESSGEKAARAEALEEFEDDPSRNPEDDRLKGLKGG